MGHSKKLFYLGVSDPNGGEKDDNMNTPENTGEKQTDRVTGFSPTTTQMIMAFRLILFLGYLGISGWLLGEIFVDKGCFVRQSYHQVALSSFVSNSLYTATQVIRRPPSSRVEVLAHVSVRDKQKVADLGAFPTMIASPVEDAAFWPVLVQMDVNLNEIFGKRLAGNFSETIAVLLGGNDTDNLLASASKGKMLYNQTESLDTIYKPILENLLGHLNDYGAGGVSAIFTRLDKKTETPLDLFNLYSKMVEATRPGTYILMGDGRVVAPDLPMPVEISNLMTALRAQSMHGRDIGGLLPNIGRCVDPIKMENKTVTINGVKKEMEVAVDKEIDRWIHDVADIVTHSHLRGSCILTGQVSMVDVSSNYKTSATPFSSSNVLYLMLIIVWISASFSLFHLMGPDLIPDKNVMWERIQMVMKFLLFAWHIVIVVLTVLPIMYTEKNVPLNNVLLSAVLIFVTIIMQMKSFSQKDALKEVVNPENDSQKFDESILEGYENSENPFHQDSKYKGNPLQPNLVSRFHMGRKITYVSMEAGEFKEKMKKGMISVQQMFSVKDSKNLKYMEYAITSPLLFASVLAAISPSASTSAIILTYLSSLAFYLICMATTKFTDMAKNFRSDEKLMGFTGTGTAILCIVAILASYNCLYIFGVYGTRYGTTNEPDNLLSASVWIIVVLQIIFTISFVLFSGVQAFALFPKQADNLDFVFMLLLSFINIMFKVFVPILVASSSLQGRFPEQGCSMWADTQAFA